MYRRAALWFGVIFLALGIFGFIGFLTPKDASGTPLLFGLLGVGLSHDLLRLVTGLLALGSAAISDNLARWYFRIMGLVATIASLYNLVVQHGDASVTNLTMADILLRLIIGLAAIAIGFGSKPKAINS
jgi:hypothetical protein